MSEITNTKENLNMLVKDLGVKEFFDEVESLNDEDTLGYRRILQFSSVSWVYLPEYALMKIFKMLNGKDLANAGRSC